ncbi:MAG: tetratricopeptide repeat protein [Elusimicrobiales bacterium]|nr:tetratricopeptide repeat protein [Elusimicrobiales bacterium]
MNDVIEMIEKKLDDEDVLSARKMIEKLDKNSPYRYYFIAESKRIEGFLKNAIYDYLRAIKGLKDMDREKYFNSLLKISAIYRSEGDKKNTLKYINMAEKINPNSLELMIEKAMYYRMIGNFEKAISIFNRVKEKYILEKDYAGVSYIMWAIGGILRLKGMFKESIKSYQNAISHAKRVKDSSLEVYSLFGLAGVLRVSGEIKKSYEIYRKSLSLISTDDSFATAYVHCGMANSLRQSQRLDDAIKNYRISYKYYSKINDSLDLALVLWGAGECYKKKNKLDTALKLFKKASKLFKTGFEPRGEILNMISTAETLYLLGNIKEANKIYFNAIAKAKKNHLYTYLERFT